MLDSCIAGDEQKLIIDLIRLLKSDIAKKKPVQILVLQNIVSKLLKNNNHHYASLIKDLSGLFKNELGPTNYALLSEVFGLARSTTASQHGSEMRLDPGINSQALLTAGKNSPVNEASDGARALRYLEARKKADGNVILVGEGWDPCKAFLEKMKRKVIKMTSQHLNVTLTKLLKKTPSQRRCRYII